MVRLAKAARAAETSKVAGIDDVGPDNRHVGFFPPDRPAKRRKAVRRSRNLSSSSPVACLGCHLPLLVRSGDEGLKGWTDY